MKQQTFKSVDDILRYYGWEAPIKVVEVRKDESSADKSKSLPADGEDRKRKRDPDGDAETGVPDELRQSR
ncbi:hypothetical protein MKX33_00800 [Paenibacillus sp. FSL R5-0490]|uniref:hypothetical protein n=1 Tax=Paenibacillus sp. FSL R5-0490 TaxID=1920424 RepID=UPI0030CC5010